MTNNLETLKALALAATPGEWKFEPVTAGDQSYRITTEEPSEGLGWHDDAGDYALMHDQHYYPLVPDDKTAKFIAAANPKTVIELIEVMEMMAEALRGCHYFVDDNGASSQGFDDELVNDALARYEALTSHPPPAS